MTIIKLNESGYEQALFGLSLNKYPLHEYEDTGLGDIGNRILMMEDRAKQLAHKDGGHNKFLEHIITWWMIQAPRYWWSQFDTYRHISKQSESTMNSIMTRQLTQDDFEGQRIPDIFLTFLNNAIQDNYFEAVKAWLPESYLQTREVVVSYKSLRNIILQRKNHRLDEWKQFCKAVLEQVEYPDLLPELSIEKSDEK